MLTISPFDQKIVVNFFSLLNKAKVRMLSFLVFVFYASQSWPLFSQKIFRKDHSIVVFWFCYRDVSSTVFCVVFLEIGVFAFSYLFLVWLGRITQIQIFLRDAVINFISGFSNFVPGARCGSSWFDFILTRA